jgi:antitoxin VapB
MIHLSRETEALARRLAAKKGMSPEEAVRRAIEQSAHEAGLSSLPETRRESPGAIAARIARIDAIVEEITRTPVLEMRSPREALTLNHRRPMKQ